MLTDMIDKSGVQLNMTQGGQGEGATLNTITGNIDIELSVMIKRFT